jgi:hypothetical protein
MKKVPVLNKTFIKHTSHQSSKVQGEVLYYYMQQSMKIYIYLFINIFYDLFNDNVE